MELRRLNLGWKPMLLLCALIFLFSEDGTSQNSAHWEIAASADDWIPHENGWKLNADGAGESWICFCPIDSLEELAGRSIRFHWSQSFAGSAQNFSRVHLIPHPNDGWETGKNPPFPITEWANYAGLSNGNFLHLGESGSSDSIRWMQTPWEGAMIPIGSSDLPGTSGHIEHWMEWHQHPGSDSAMLQISDTSEPYEWVYAMSAAAGITPKCLGFSAKYTSSHSNDFRVQIESFSHHTNDSIGPQLLGFDWIDEQALEFCFNEPLTDNLGFGIWPNGDSLFFATEPYMSSKRIGLISEPWPAGQPRYLELNGIEDANGISTSFGPIQVLRTHSLEMQPHQIQLTEIMFDPTPSMGLIEVEWVEIYNRTGLFHSIQDFFLLDGSSETLSALSPLFGWNGILPPGARAIISESDVRIGGDSTLQALGNPWPGLNNEGESLMLLGQDGSAADFLHYTADWINESNGGGVSLQITDWDACNGASNWGASSDSLGSTPGYAAEQEGEAISEAENLVLIAAIPTNPTTGRLVFNQPLDFQSNITFNGAHPGYLTWDIAIDSSIFWKLSASNPTQEINFTIAGLSACSHASSSHTKWPVHISPQRFPEFQDVIISEIAHEPKGMTEEWGSFVEVTNVHPTDSLELGGLICNDAQVSERILLAPGHRYCFENVTLPNIAGIVSVQSASGIVIDEVNYSRCWHRKRSDEGSGKSLVRIELNPGVHGFFNWNSSADPRGCSPNLRDPAEESVSFEPVPIACGIFENRWAVAFNGPVEIASPNWDVFPHENQSGGYHMMDAKQLWIGPSKFQSLTDSISLVNWSTQKVSISSICPSSSSVTMVGICDFLLHEVQPLKLQGSEPFIEIVQTEYSWLNTQGLSLATATVPNPNDWKPVSPVVNWFIANGAPVAFSTCPGRLSHHGGRIIPLDLPSLWGNREVQLARSGAMIDSIHLHPGHDSPWSNWQHLRSLERITDQNSMESECPQMQRKWASSLDVLGSTPGKSNSWQDLLVIDSPNAIALEILNDTWGNDGISAIDPIRIRIRAPGTGAWNVSVSITSASGLAIASIGDRELWILEGQEKEITWDGFIRGKIPPPGTYWVSAHFHSENNNQLQKYFRPVHIMPWR